MKRFWIDLLFTLFLPMVIWNVGKDALGDYYAILLSTVPGFIYGVTIFILSKRFNLFGFFLLFNLLLGGLVDILSGNMENMLRNQMYISIGYALIILVLLLIKRPLPLYFIVDIAVSMGYDRKESMDFFRQSDLYKFVLFMTIISIVQNTASGLIKGFYLYMDGAIEYTFILLMLRISSGIFFAINGVLIALLMRKVKQFRLGKTAPLH
ncbi:hypothetical protein IEO70_13045 [Bacillus sp. AGMB 02131]|uniref:Uncharacterized protein n=1 Tax=Peribacillus faecalis TaxID=2772559 RepID=A0A927D1E9_9BACI|nr:VC0807 family protein [Peribacillus faecalis]MBD3109274.1 hypothetical protein [Peribacillus faecalis]